MFVWVFDFTQERFRERDFLFVILHYLYLNLCVNKTNTLLFVDYYSILLI